MLLNSCPQELNCLNVLVSVLHCSHTCFVITNPFSVCASLPVCSQGSLVNTMREVRPTAFMGVPRVWEKMQEKMKSVGAKSSTVRRKVAVWAKGVGLKTNLSKMNQYVYQYEPVCSLLNRVRGICVLIYLLHHLWF